MTSIAATESPRNTRHHLADPPLFTARRTVSVKTLTRNHGGSYAGKHARYCLRDMVSAPGGNLTKFLASPKGRREFPGLPFGGAA